MARVKGLGLRRGGGGAGEGFTGSGSVGCAAQGVDGRGDREAVTPLSIMRPGPLRQTNSGV